MLPPNSCETNSVPASGIGKSGHPADGAYDTRKCQTRPKLRAENRPLPVIRAQECQALETERAAGKLVPEENRTRSVRSDTPGSHLCGGTAGVDNNRPKSRRNEECIA